MKVKIELLCEKKAVEEIIRCRRPFICKDGHWIDEMLCDALWYVKRKDLYP